ncbi:MAG TPA: hypothetical protein VEB69_13135 [Acidimicrobiia bacterium]|nr:hypothetical protein [Acidimicrobiia bacterium]
MPKELRVHGVSGTPPRNLLYNDPVSYDRGPDLAKVYEPVRDSWTVKAFHWGSLTSKSSITAFWILLAPFAMANVAGWMSESPNIWSRIWIRLAGLTLTGILFAQLANMSLDIPVSSGVSQGAAFWIYLTLCVLAILGLGLLSTQSTFKKLTFGERFRFLFAPAISSMHPTMKAVPEWDDPSDDYAVVGLRMWSIHSIVHRLRRIHIAFGAAVLALVAGRAAGSDVVEIAAISIAAVAMICLAFSTGAFAVNRVVLGLTAILPLAGVIVLIWGQVALATGSLDAGNIADDLTFQIALILGLSAGFGLIGEVVAGRLRSGWVPLGLLAVATLIGANLGLTGAMLVETYLTAADTTSDTFDAGATFVTVGMLGLALVMAGTFVVAMWMGRQDPTSGSRFRGGILRARWMLAAAGLYSVIFAIVAVVWSCTGEITGCTQNNIVMADWVVEDPDNLTVFLGIPFDPGSLLGWAKLLMVAIPSVLIVRSIVGGLLNGQDSRRQVGILWDLGSFWPRWFHPLAPPAYGPYAVTRLQTVIDQERPDVVAAHSQGSLISAVAMSLTPADRVPGLFVTYGSQIGHLYPALFPAVGLDHLVTTVDSQLEGRWLNLWRGTDAIGGQVIDRLGSRNWEVVSGAGHSFYELTPEFCAARRAVESRVLTRPEDAEMANCWEQVAR